MFGLILRFNQIASKKTINLNIFQKIPVIGPKVHEPISNFFVAQRSKLHAGKSDESGGNVLGHLFEGFIFLMVSYFIVTIVNSLAQARVARKQKEARENTFKKSD